MYIFYFNIILGTNTVIGRIVCGEKIDLRMVDSFHVLEWILIATLDISNVLLYSKFN